MPTKAPHVHFESLTDRAVFHISADVVDALSHRHPDALSGADVTRGENCAGMPGVLRDTQVLVTSEFVLSHPRFPLRSLATAAPALQLIHVTNAGIEKLLPLDWLPPAVQLTNSSGAHFDKACEYAAMSLLMLNAKMPRMMTNQAHARWEKVLTPTSRGKTLCVVGTGSVGLAFVKEGARLGMRVTGVSRSGNPVPGVDRMFTTTALTAALATADLAVVSTPLTPATRGLFGAREFDAMPAGGAFINVGRARVVDYAALCERLSDGRLSGAMIDVFEQEPLPPESPLWRTPNLVMTPHVALDDSERFLANCLDIAADNLARLRDGRPLRNLVEPGSGY